MHVHGTSRRQRTETAIGHDAIASPVCRSRLLALNQDVQGQDECCNWVQNSHKQTSQTNLRRVVRAARSSSFARKPGTHGSRVNCRPWRGRYPMDGQRRQADPPTYHGQPTHLGCASTAQGYSLLPSSVFNGVKSIMLSLDLSVQ